MKGNPTSRAQGERTRVAIAHAQGERTRAAITVAIAGGAIRQKEIQVRIGLSPGVVSHNIRRLIAAGRVREVTPRRGRIPPTYAVVEP